MAENWGKIKKMLKAGFAASAAPLASAAPPPPREDGVDVGQLEKEAVGFEDRKIRTGRL